MRRCFWCFFILIAFSCRHYPKMSGVYFSAEQDAIVAEDGKGVIETFGNNTIDNLSVKQRRNNIVFKSVAKGRIPILQRHVSRYRFKVLSDLDDVFKLSPSSALSKKYFNDRDSIVFRPRFRFVDKSFLWDSITYHSGHCFGWCPDFSLTIDKYGKLKLTNRGTAYDKPPLNNNYMRFLSANQREQLQRIISLSQIRTLKWAPLNCCDGPMHTLIIYSNRDRFYFKAMWTPVVTGPLVNFLSKQFNNHSLLRVDSTFSYDR
jgi:hypothetical protein